MSVEPDGDSGEGDESFGEPDGESAGLGVWSPDFGDEDVSWPVTAAALPWCPCRR